MEKIDGRDGTILALGGYSIIPCISDCRHGKTRIMCGAVDEDDVNQDVDTDDLKQSNGKVVEDVSDQEDDGYYTPGSDPQE